MVNRPVGNVRVPPLPANVAAFVRVNKTRKLLNDYVEDAHRALFDIDQQYTKFLDAVYDEDTVEGSLNADDLEAAAIIRQYAKDQGIAEVATKKKVTIAKSLRVVLKRYEGQSRADRRNMVGGEIVPSQYEASN